MIISDFFNVLLSSGLTIFIIIIILAILIASYEKDSPNEVLIIIGGCLVKKGPYLIEDPETHTRVKVVKGGWRLCHSVHSAGRISNARHVQRRRFGRRHHDDRCVCQRFASRRLNAETDRQSA